MSRAVKKKTRLFHATIQVTRLEEWCVEASDEAEALRLLESGDGHRCDSGQLLHLEVGRLLQQ